MENLLLKTTQAWQIWVIFGEQRDAALSTLPGSVAWPHRDIPGCVSAELPVALQWPGGDGDRCHTPDQKLSIPLMDKHISEPCIIPSWNTSGGKQSARRGRWAPVAGDGDCWMIWDGSASCATHLETGNASRGKEATPAKCTGKQKQQKEKEQLQENPPCQTARFPPEWATQMDSLLSTYLFLSRNRC